MRTVVVGSDFFEDAKYMAMTRHFCSKLHQRVTQAKLLPLFVCLVTPYM